MATQVFLPGNSHRQKAWQATVHSVAESDMIEQLSMWTQHTAHGTHARAHTHTRLPHEVYLFASELHTRDTHAHAHTHTHTHTVAS